jgi:hypothetical protein
MYCCFLLWVVRGGGVLVFLFLSVNFM